MIYSYDILLSLQTHFCEAPQTSNMSETPKSQLTTYTSLIPNLPCLLPIEKMRLLQSKTNMIPRSIHGHSGTRKGRKLEVGFHSVFMLWNKLMKSFAAHSIKFGFSYEKVY